MLFTDGWFLKEPADWSISTYRGSTLFSSLGLPFDSLELFCWLLFMLKSTEAKSPYTNSKFFGRLPFTRNFSKLPGVCALWSITWCSGLTPWAPPTDLRSISGCFFENSSKSLSLALLGFQFSGNSRLRKAASQDLLSDFAWSSLLSGAI